MAPPSKTIYQVAVLLFEGADTLDFAGPVEFLSHTMHDQDTTAPEPAFKIDLIARTPTILADNIMTVGAHTTIEDAISRIDSYDILVVPGGRPADLLLDLAKPGIPEGNLIRAFNNTPKNDRREERILLSVCTGGLMVAATGVLKGLKATTHHRVLDMLKRIDASIDVVATVGEQAVGRYVDGGLNESGVRVVTTGGVTCGIDAALYVAELKVGRDQAEFVARLEEHEWKRA